VGGGRPDGGGRGGRHLQRRSGVKQLVFMVLFSAVGMVGSFTHGPFVGLCVYIFYDLLRPQFVWQWVLPPGVNWSLFVALAALVATPLIGPSANPQLNRGGRMTVVRLLYTHRAYFLFLGWVTLTYFTAIRPAAGDFVMEGYLKTTLMYAVGIAAIHTVKQVWYVIMIFVIALGYVSYEINIQYVTTGYLGIAHNGHGGLDNNGAGMMLAMGVPLCAFAWEAYRGWYRWCFAALIPVLLHAILLTYSRGAMLSLILSAPFWVFRGGERWVFRPAPDRDGTPAGWRKSRTDKYMKWALAVGIAALVPVMAGDQIRERFFSTAKFDEDGSAQSRFTSWAIGWKMALERPIFGFGVRNSNLFTKQYGADLEGRTIHSQYLQVAADNGIVGLGLYLFLTGAGMWGYQKTIRAARRRTDEDSRLATTAAMAAQASLVTFLAGAVFLSCEMFEPQYWLLMLGLHLPLVYAPASGEMVRAQRLAYRPWAVAAPVGVGR
jgi:O-antigen ligase